MHIFNILIIIITNILIINIKEKVLCIFIASYDTFD